MSEFGSLASATVRDLANVDSRHLTPRDRARVARWRKRHAAEIGIARVARATVRND